MRNRRGASIRAANATISNFVAESAPLRGMNLVARVLGIDGVF
jgi:hypothetical protein